MGETLRFAVLGDVHYVRRNAHKESFGGLRGEIETRDIARNYWMTQNVLPETFSAIAKLDPSFVIQTGDFVHGHCDDESEAMKEMAEALDLFQTVGAPFFFALGTHDGVLGRGQDKPVKELLLPSMAKTLGQTPEEGYYVFERNGSLFSFFNYATFKPGDHQERFVDDTFSASDAYAHTFVFAHPPVIPVGRPFFGSLEFSQTLIGNFSRVPIDAYFCGHTHNQVASIHKVDDRWFPQLKSSILGYPEGIPVRLEDVRPILPDAASFEYGWGFLEDSAPGWWLVSVDGEQVKADWYVLGRGVSGSLQWNRGEKPLFTSRPQFAKGSHSLPPLSSVRSVRLKAAGSGCASPDAYIVSLNGITIGQLPELKYFDCRQFLEIDSIHWSSLRRQNRLQVSTGSEAMCIGGFVIEIETAEGWSRSSLCPSYFASTSQWDSWGIRLEHIQPGQVIELELCFEG